MTDNREKEYGIMQLFLTYEPIVKSQQRVMLDSGRDICDFMSEMIDIRSKQKATFYVMLLHTHGALLGVCKIAEGDERKLKVASTEVMRAALIGNATEVVLVHNHPSGSPYPSRLDDSMTKKIVKDMKTLGLPVKDHVVIGRNKYYSYKEHNKI